MASFGDVGSCPRLMNQRDRFGRQPLPADRGGVDQSPDGQLARRPVRSIGRPPKDYKTAPLADTPRKPIVRQERIALDRNRIAIPINRVNPPDLPSVDQILAVGESWSSDSDRPRSGPEAESIRAAAEPSPGLAGVGHYPWDQLSWLGCVASAVGGIEGLDARTAVTRGYASDLTFQRQCVFSPLGAPLYA